MEIANLNPSISSNHYKYRLNNQKVANLPKYEENNSNVKSLSLLANYNKANINFRGNDEFLNNHFDDKLEKLQDELLGDKFDFEEGFKILSRIKPYNIDLITKICFGRNEKGDYLFQDKNVIFQLIDNIKEDNIQLAEKLCFGKNEKGEDYFKEKIKISGILFAVNGNNIKQAEKLIDLFVKGEISYNILLTILRNYDITLEEYERIKKSMGQDKLEKLSCCDLITACNMSHLYQKNSICELDSKAKKDVIRNLVAENVSLYKISNELRKDFPLVPTNEDEYCSLLRDLINAIGVETRPIGEMEIDSFNQNLVSLGKILSTMKDEEFNALEFKQSYSQPDFINDTFNIVKDLESSERQKVYDYFDFELQWNDKGRKIKNKEYRFSLVGYPIDSNNGKKLSQIDNKETKEAIEKLRPKVVKFNENNHVSCNNKQIESMINEILNICPVLRTEIDRIQYEKHAFDVFKYSLKIMQKLFQNPEFEKLNDSDKKVLLYASFFHDIAKFEGVDDRLHPMKSAFDTFYIAKKFNLSEDEEIKLYSIIKSHKWLAHVNSKFIKNKREKDTRLKSVAYDLHYDNLFEMMKIFTKANFKAVKKDDSWFDNQQDAFQESATKIQSYINKLKKTQPFLPVTKIPSSSRIKEAITKVNPDGSTNLRGIYQDKNGMIIIRYNKVQNETWEKIGFPKGSKSFSIITTDSEDKEVNTGNIKWFGHGLRTKEELRKFSAFQLPDSEAVLSVTYMELPESKYRLYKTQGALLDIDTKYLHGGGKTNKDSGYKKTLELFKKEYAYKGGIRHGDRKFISDLIKKHLNLSDEEYIEFVKNNRNKAILEIKPEEYQEKLVKAYAKIHSEIQHENKKYNEIYVTNPRIMAVYAYSEEDDVGDTMSFVASQKDFLKQYALDNDMPFVIFGN